MSRLLREPSTSEESLVRNEDLSAQVSPPVTREMSSLVEQTMTLPGSRGNADEALRPEGFSNLNRTAAPQPAPQPASQPAPQPAPVTVLPKKRFATVEPVIALYSLAYAMSQPLTMEFIHHRLVVST